MNERGLGVHLLLILRNLIGHVFSEISCEGVEDGAYSLGCMPEFILCMHGEGLLLHCKNPDWVFDEQSLQCQPEVGDIDFSLASSGLTYAK